MTPRPRSKVTYTGTMDAVVGNHERRPSSAGQDQAERQDDEADLAGHDADGGHARSRP